MAVNATAVWRVRPSGSNTNGGGFDSGIAGAGTDYSQQNAAQATGTAGTASGTTAFSDTAANAFTSAMVGNALYLTGTGFTTGFYFVTGFADSGHVTLDRSPGTGTTGTWHLGGGWADFYANCLSTGPLVAGNTVYILGNGTPNPSAYSYDYTITPYGTPASGDTTNGYITFANDPNTPAGGYPCIHCSLIFNGGNYLHIKGLWFVANSSSYNGVFQTAATIENCVLDQAGFDIGLNVSASVAKNCEIFSSSAGTGSKYAIGLASGGLAIGCNIHDCTGSGILMGADSMAICNIIAKNQKDGIHTTQTPSAYSIIGNNTIDGNGGNGISMSAQAVVMGTQAFNNIISNHTAAGTYGMLVSSGSTAVSERMRGFIDYNTFYNNTTNYSGINAGAHDTQLATSPYVAQSTENYTLA